MSYRRFAMHYDVLTGNIDYDARARYFDGLIREHIEVTKNTILLDLACGTGNLSVRFAALGYDVIGVDMSADMLSQALAKESARPVLYLCQPMDELDLYGTVDVCVCALDSLNHVTDPVRLQRAIERVALFTAPGGLFVFDVNTVYKHRHVLADNTFVYDLEDVFCVWQNRTGEASQQTDMKLDFFVKEADGRYTRESDELSERAYGDKTLRGMLARAGFELLQVYAGDTKEPVLETTQTAVYVARKRK